MANSVSVREDVCKGCALCNVACPKNIMVLDKSRINSKGYHISGCTDLSACIACAMCAKMCPDCAITVEKG